MGGVFFEDSLFFSRVLEVVFSFFFPFLYIRRLALFDPSFWERALYSVPQIFQPFDPFLASFEYASFLKEYLPSLTSFPGRFAVA